MCLFIQGYGVFFWSASDFHSFLGKNRKKHMMYLTERQEVSELARWPPTSNVYPGLPHSVIKLHLLLLF